MKKIKGIELDEIEDLDFNLYKIRKELREKTSFWSYYNAAVTSYEKEKNVPKAGLFLKTTLFITLLPVYIKMFFFSTSTESLEDKI